MIIKSPICLFGKMNISNATINVVNSNTNLENLFARAEEYKKQGNYAAALEYYNRVLDERKVVFVTAFLFLQLVF